MRAGNRLDLDDALRGRRCPCPASGQHPCSRCDALAFLKVGGIAPDEQDFLSAAEPRHAQNHLLDVAPFGAASDEDAPGGAISAPR